MFRPWEGENPGPSSSVPIESDVESDIDVLNVDTEGTENSPITPEITSTPKRTPPTDEIPGSTPKRTPGRRYASKTLSKREQQMVLNLLNYFKAKGERQFVLKTSKALKVGYSTVKKISKGGVTSPKKVNKLRFRNIHGFVCDLIRRTIYEMYKSKEVPTIPSLYAKLLEKTEHTDYEFPYCERTLLRVVKSLGFHHRKLNNRQVLMESTRIASLRYAYLRTIHKCRSEGMRVIYLDETWYDTHDIVSKGWVDHSNCCTLDAPVSRGKRVIILHAGSQDGWVPGCLLLSAKEIARSSADYHQDMTAELFEEWFVQQLIPNLPADEKCSIVLDNASYHSRLLVRPPTTNSKKSDILSFMKDNNIKVPNPIPTRPVLLQLARAANIPRQYVIDRLAATHGHQVVRLPPYYCVFNPIEIIWSNLKRGVRRNNKSPEVNAEVVDAIRREEAKIGSDLWAKCVEHTIKVEQSYANWDSWNDTNIIINLQDDTDSNESSDDEVDS